MNAATDPVVHTSTPAQDRKLLDRIQAHQLAGRGTDVADGPRVQPVSHYVGTGHLVEERSMMASTPTVAGLSGLIPEEGSFATVEVGGRSVIITRAEGGDVAAMLNVCRHRGAEVASGRGQATLLRCPYHGWTYRLDGTGAARRRTAYFEGLELGDLVALPVRERDGLIWVNADPEGAIDDQPLCGAEEQIGPLDLEHHRLFARTRFSRQINWKLAIDTFCETYHIPVLHHETIAPMIHGDFSLFDAFGPHGRMVTTRTSIPDRPDSLLQHTTIVWVLVPNTVLIYQQDHAQLYQAEPGPTPDESTMTVSLYVPEGTTRSDRHWQRNFDLLVDVTDTEDFTTAAGIQRGFHSGAQTHVVQGANEPTLQHFHESLAALLAR